jgi:hypothetical protein
VLANPGKYNRSETPSGPSSFDISVNSVFVINVKFMYLNARKRNLEITFHRYSRDFVTSQIVITEFDCSFIVIGFWGEYFNLRWKK